MIDFNELRKAYENKVGYTVFMEEGEMLDFYRSVNTIVKPVCGIFSTNPIAMTAINAPFIGILTVNIEMLAPPDRWEEVSQKMNVVATELNGTTEHYTDEDGKKYAVSHNCQTASVDGHILDVSIGCGEVFPIRQTISYIIIESGVSAYDAKLWIDGMEVPILSLAENKIHTTSVYATDNGDGNTASEMESYGIDFTTPYTTDAVCDLFREAVNNKTGNTAHCVMIEKNGIKSCYIMQFANASNSISPPQNIGFNISMTEIHPSVADFDGLWAEKTVSGGYAPIYLDKIRTNDSDIREVTVFWGDGKADHYDTNQGTYYHIYDDGRASHVVRVFKTYDSNLAQFAHNPKATYNLLGKPLRFRTESPLVAPGIESFVIWASQEIAGSDIIAEATRPNVRAFIATSTGFEQTIDGSRVLVGKTIDDGAIVYSAVDDVRYVNGAMASITDCIYIDRRAVHMPLEG